MKYANLSDMVRGWFVGNFTPSAFVSENCEVAAKRYIAGESEDAHFHKIATEITLVLSGGIRMAGGTWGAGDIIVLSPGESTAFMAIEDSVVVVVKVPGVRNDRYLT